MIYRLRNLTRNNSFNKFAALLIGYQFWIMLANNTIASNRLVVPLCFYGSHDTIIEQAPEEVTVVLQAQRNVLMNLDTENLCVHIDTDRLKQGPQSLSLTHDHLLLPSATMLKETIPSNITVNIKKHE